MPGGEVVFVGLWSAVCLSEKCFNRCISAGCVLFFVAGCRAVKVIKAKRQPACKPGSVHCERRGVSVIYPGLPSPASSIVLPSDVLSSGGPPYNIGLHGLSTPEVHGLTCRHAAGGLLHHLLTLAACAAVIFFCTTLPSRTTSC